MACFLEKRPCPQNEKITADVIILGLGQEILNCAQVTLAILNIWPQQACRNNEDKHRFE